MPTHKHTHQGCRCALPESCAHTHAHAHTQHTHTRTQTREHIPTHTRTHISHSLIYAHVCMCVYVCVYTALREHTAVLLCASGELHTHTHKYTYTYTHTNQHTHTHTQTQHTQTPTHLHTHTHTHTHTRANILSIFHTFHPEVLYIRMHICHKDCVFKCDQTCTWALYIIYDTVYSNITESCTWNIDWLCYLYCLYFRFYQIW